MTKKILWLGILAIALVLGMTVVGCGGGGGDGPVPIIPVPQTVSYQSADTAGYTYILVITVKGSTAVAGDSYVLTIKKSGQSDRVSRGIISAIGTEGALTLKPNTSGSGTFSVTINNEQMTAINGTIAIGEGEGETVTAPGTVTPQDNSGGGGSGGTFTLTGIPSQYNGKYAVMVTFDDGRVMGAQNISTTTGLVTFSLISSNGSVSLPTWTHSGDNWVRYSGNDTFDVYFGISNSAALETFGPEDFIGERWFSSVIFSNGSATRSWSQGNNNGNNNGTSSDFTYTEENGTITITGYTGNATSVTIPAQINGKPVASIGWDAFKGFTNLISVVIPNSVTTIWGSAFENCTSLASITIPDSVTTISYSVFTGTAWFNNQPDGLVYAGKVAYKYKGTMPANTSITLLEGTKGIANQAFYGCAGLTSITIPNSVISIGYFAFEFCSSLPAITLAAGNTAYIAENGVLYTKDKTVLLTYPAGKTGTAFTIPSSVNNIVEGAFHYCSSLTSITIPNSVTSIGGWAFGLCSSLTSITIPDSVTSIKETAFYGCTSLTSVTFQGTMTADNLDSDSFPGDLRDKYLAGGIGTYTRPNGDSTTWTKQ
jgi:hypothetical protein